MASMEMLDTSCHASGCAARATFVVKGGNGIDKIGYYCRRHAPDALKTQNDKERAATTGGTSGQPMKGVTAQ